MSLVPSSTSRVAKWFPSHSWKEETKKIAMDKMVKAKKDHRTDLESLEEFSQQKWAVRLGKDEVDLRAGMFSHRSPDFLCPPESPASKDGDIIEIDIDGKSTSPSQETRREGCTDSTLGNTTKKEPTTSSYLNYASIDRLRASKLTVETFARCYERPKTPCVLLELTKKWTAEENWNFGRLLKLFGEYRVKCGEDDDGDKIRVKLKYFLHYVAHNCHDDDSPMYVFDSTFADDDSIGKELRLDYEVPVFFQEDIFSYVGEKTRPPYRWWLIGPKRSGTNLHIDPLSTAAWNTVIVGVKRWVLFSPNAPEDLVKGKPNKWSKQLGIEIEELDEDDEGIDYFVNMLPRIKKIILAFPELRDTITITEFLQYPGETCYIPGNWWHAVLNLEDSIAITQNFVSTTNFPEVWRSTRTGRKKMSCKLLRKLDKYRPDLAKIARELNTKDGFVMWDKRPDKIVKQMRKEEKKMQKQIRKLTKKLNKLNKKRKKNKKSTHKKRQRVSSSDTNTGSANSTSTSSSCDEMEIDPSSEQQKDLPLSEQDDRHRAPIKDDESPPKRSAENEDDEEEDSPKLMKEKERLEKDLKELQAVIFDHEKHLIPTDGKKKRKKSKKKKQKAFTSYQQES
eukprot:g1299.t1